MFPEAFVGGYPKGLDFGARLGSRTPEGREDFRRYFETAIDLPGPEVLCIGEIARDAGVHLVVGIIERDGGTLYCSMLTYAPAQGDDPSTVLIRGGSCIVDPLGNVLVEPDFTGETIKLAEIDRRMIARGKYDLDVAGHYARPDVFHLSVDRRQKTAVTFETPPLLAAPMFASPDESVLREAESSAK